MKKFVFIMIALLCVPSLASAKYCRDFKTQAEAQKWYEQRKKSGQTGWKRLDRDGDGSACDCLPGGNGTKCPKGKKK